MKKAYFQMHTAILLWGFTGILGKAITLSEGMIVWYRMIISAVGLIPLLIFTRSKLPNLRELVNIALVGTLVALHWILFYASIKASNVTVALSCFSSIALFTAILDPLFRRELPRWPEVLLGLTVISGLYMIFSVQKLYWTGIILAVLSALAGALFTIFNKKLTAHHPSEQITFFELFTGFLVLSFVLPAYLHFTGKSFEVPGSTDLLYLILLGLVCTSFAFTISLKALKELDPFTLNLSVNLEPVYSILLAIVLFREYDILNPGFFAGTSVILSSVVVHTWYRWRARRRAR